MTQYNTLNTKLFNSQLSKLKSGLKNVSEVTLNLLSNVVGNSNDETNFSHKLLLTNTQVSRLRKTFANGSSASVKVSKTQLFKMIQTGVFVELTNKMFGRAVRDVLEVPYIINSIDKDKSIPKTLLDAENNLLKNKIDVKP